VPEQTDPLLVANFSSYGGSLYPFLGRPFRANHPSSEEESLSFLAPKFVFSPENAGDRSDEGVFTPSSFWRFGFSLRRPFRLRFFFWRCSDGGATQASFLSPTGSRLLDAGALQGLYIPQFPCRLTLSSAGVLALSIPCPFLKEALRVRSYSPSKRRSSFLSRLLVVLPHGRFSCLIYFPSL